jgi:hypothetical protein
MNRRFEDDFLPSIRDWCLLHAEKVSKCYATMHRGYPSVFVIGSSAKRSRRALDQPLIDLGRNLRRRGWEVELLPIPHDQAEHYDAFLAIERATLVYE